jgi:hypothetical protein
MRRLRHNEEIVIIQTRTGSLLLITQPDHAALSAAIMRHWLDGGLPTHPRRDSILRATGEHDNGWREVDASPLVDGTSGGLLDFMSAPADVRRAIWPRGVEHLAADPWAAALVAQHAVHVYRHYRDDASWAGFFTEMEAARDRHLRQADGLSLDDLLQDYFFVRMGDLLSLTFCNGWSEGPEQPGYAIRLDGSRLVVTPDPFRGETLVLSVRARELPNKYFESQQDAARAFAASRVLSWVGSFAGEE